MEKNEDTPEIWFVHRRKLTDKVLEKEKAAAEKAKAAAPELLEALIAALPYVEMAEHDETYKKGAVNKIVKQMQAAIKKATL
jgi:hypothetical protein